MNKDKIERIQNQVEQNVGILSHTGQALYRREQREQAVLVDQLKERVMECIQASDWTLKLNHSDRRKLEPFLEAEDIKPHLKGMALDTTPEFICESVAYSMRKEQAQALDQIQTNIMPQSWVDAMERSVMAKELEEPEQAINPPTPTQSLTPRF